MGAPQAKPRLVLVLTAMTLANAMILVDQTAVPLALPDIMQTFHVGSSEHTFVGVLPGLVVYVIGLSLVLTTNDPVSLDTIPEADQGQASGVSATAEQFGGALGIAALYSVFHAVYVQQLHEGVNASRLPDLSAASYRALKAGIEAAETTGLRVEAFNVKLQAYLVTFLAVAGIALVGSALVAWLVRKPTRKAEDPAVADVQSEVVSG